MDTKVLLADKSYETAANEARLFLGIFGLKWSQEVRSVDVSQESIYEVKSSSTKKEVTSLRTDWILSLSPERCVALVCDKKKSRQIGLNGQQGTLNGRYAVEVYADGRKGKFGLTGTAETIIHEIMHALAEYHNVSDTLHVDLKAGKTLEQCREILLDRILKKDNPWGLLPAVARLAERMLAEYPTIQIKEGYRTPERQNELFNNGKGVTKAKAWESIHQYRCAFDYCFKGKTIEEMYPPSGDQKWNRVNVFSRSLGLYSYGLEENWDDGHVQLMFGLSEKKVRSRDIDWTPYWNAPVRPEFDRDLSIGSTGEDVTRLQKFLNGEGFLVAKSGPGSPGLETAYFGLATKDAVARYQKSKGIEPAHGYFGPLTRNSIR